MLRSNRQASSTVQPPQLDKSAGTMQLSKTKPIKSAPSAPPVQPPVPPRRRLILGGISFKEKIFLSKNLGIMLKSGISLSAALRGFIEQTPNKTTRKIITAVAENVEQGQSFASALAKYPRAFDHFFISLIEIGEESGTLEQSLNFLAKQLNKDYNLRKKVKGAMLYPGIILAATFLIGGFIGLFILPKLVDFFAAFKTNLPLATRILLGLANFMKDYGLITIAGAVGAMIIFFILIQLPIIKPLWHRLVLKAPIFGKMIQYNQLARFSRNLGILLKNGIPLTRGLEVTALTFSNVKFKTDLNKVSDGVKKGQQVGDLLSQKGLGEFPMIVSRMVKVGEATGKLDETLIYLADFYEDEIDNIAKNLTTILEPFLLIGIGLVVGFVALAIIMPIYDLTGSISQ